MAGERPPDAGNYSVDTAPSVPIPKFAGVRSLVLSEFLDLNHTSAVKLPKALLRLSGHLSQM